MQLKARYRREVVEEILDIQIFSLMNMLLKQKLKTISDDLRDIDFQIELTTEKIELQKKYIDDVKKNKDKIIKEKTSLVSGNEEEIFVRQGEIDLLKKDNDVLLIQISDTNKIQKNYNKLKTIQATLVEKHKSHSTVVDFFENNDDCPTCEQHIDEIFKKDMIFNKQKDVDKFSNGLKELEEELKKSKNRQKEISDITDKIRENEVQIAKDNSSVVQLEKFNSTLQTEIKQLLTGDVSKSDYDKLKKSKDKLKSIDSQKTKLREDKTYSEAAKNMLQDTGIKTKIIKQYLPIMNRLINTYLTSMEFYINFTLNESFEETIKSRFRDEFTYDSFSEGEKMRIDLALLFTWRAIAKMKNSTNTNLLMLDEIFDSSLDSAGTDEFLKILNTLTDENVFVISHKQDILVDKFRSTIKFEKIRNFSHITE
jgi:DNA repair exonuclease SbcCD ATPase subunit